MFLFKVDDAVKSSSHKGERRNEYNITIKIKGCELSLFTFL